MGIEKDNVTPCVCKEGEGVEEGCPYANADVDANAGGVVEEEKKEEEGGDGMGSSPAFTKRKVGENGWGWTYNPRMMRRWSKGSVEWDDVWNAEKYGYDADEFKRFDDPWTRGLGDQLPGLKPPPRAFHDFDKRGHEDVSWVEGCRSSVTSSSSSSTLSGLTLPPDDIEAQAQFISATEETLRCIENAEKGLVPSSNSPYHHNDSDRRPATDSRTAKSSPFRRFLSTTRRRLLNSYVLTILLLNVILILCCLGIYLGVKKKRESEHSA